MHIYVFKKFIHTIYILHNKFYIKKYMYLSKKQICPFENFRLVDDGGTRP